MKYLLLSLLFSSLALAQEAGLDIKIGSPTTCIVTFDKEVTVAKWQAFKDKVEYKTKKGPWTAQVLTCADMKVPASVLADADYIVFYSSLPPHTMCIHGKSEKCPVQVYPPE